MNTIRFVQNGVGEMEPVPVKSTQGLSLFNANGDVSDSATGFKYATDTLSYIKQEVTRQKFHTVNFADYMPVSIGRGGFAEQIFTNLRFSNGGSFASGIISTGANTRLANVDVSSAKKSQAIKLWAKQLTYSIPEVEQALQANNWDTIMDKEASRKENWDLGLQEVAFLGLQNDSDVTGLLNQADATIDTTTITKAIKSMSAAELKTLVGNLIGVYFAATNSTQMPTKFVIPFSDFLGLTVMVENAVGAIAGVPVLTYLLTAFREATRNPNFQILPSAYAEAAANTAYGINKQCYALYNDDPRSMQMEVPIQYTTSSVGTSNNWTFQNVGYGRFGGLGLFRNLELIYFRY